MSTIERGCLLVETGSVLPHVKFAEGVDAVSAQDVIDMLLNVSPPGAASSDGTLAGSSLGRKAADARVILLLSDNEEEGSRGLILNKATPFRIGNFTNKLPMFENAPINYGGDGSRSPNNQDKAGKDLRSLHGYREILGSEEIVDGVFLGADVKHASHGVGAGKARATDIKFFYSEVHWGCGELQAEIAQGKWVAAACAKELILKPANYWDKPLWRMVLELMGGKFALISRYLSADL